MVLVFFYERYPAMELFLGIYTTIGDYWGLIVLLAGTLYALRNRLFGIKPDEIQFLSLVLPLTQPSPKEPLVIELDEYADPCSRSEILKNPFLELEFQFRIWLARWVGTAAIPVARPWNRRAFRQAREVDLIYDRFANVVRRSGGSDLVRRRQYHDPTVRPMTHLSQLIRGNGPGGMLNRNIDAPFDNWQRIDDHIRKGGWVEIGENSGADPGSKAAQMLADDIARGAANVMSDSRGDFDTSLFGRMIMIRRVTVLVEGDATTLRLIDAQGSKENHSPGADSRADRGAED